MAGLRFDRRYRSLDGWRAIAALAVLFHHQLLGRVALAEYGWLGVQLFFVISGYCMAAATSHALTTKMTFPTFMRRRIRRIFPPFLASVGVVLAVHVLMHVDATGWDAAFAYLRRPPWTFYLQNLTMTQWVSVPLANAREQFIATPGQNPALLIAPYWSLNYEEQFYLLCGALLLLARVARVALAVAALCGAAALYNIAAPGFISGFFLDYWLQFAVGIWLFYRLCVVTTARGARLSDALMLLALVVVGVIAFARGEFGAMSAGRYDFYAQLFVCGAFALALLLLRRFDALWCDSPAGRLMTRFGAMSYSLYVFHHALLELFGFLGAKLGITESAFAEAALQSRSAIVDCLCTLFVCACAYGLHLLFERPFAPSRQDSSPAVPPAASTVTS